MAVLSAVLVAGSLVSAQEPAVKASALKLTLAVDRSKVQVGESVQFEARLENSGDKDVEIAELTYEERSLSFSVSATFAGGRKKDYTLAVTRPDPQISARLPLARIVLGPKKSVTIFQRIPAIAPGKFDIKAKYAGADAEVASAPVTLNVDAGGQGARLAAEVDVADLGTFSIILSAEQSPANVTHFVSIVDRGFYNDMFVHRIVKGNWIQTGCPYGLGIGGPGYAVRAELDKDQKHERGSVSLAMYDRSGFGGSQFFVCLTTLPSLDGKFTPLGRVENDDMARVVEPLSKKETDRNTDAPRSPVRIKTVSIKVVK
jgi:cyclophilin family peptidyl-prolyl cis-trans isomerase